MPLTIEDAPIRAALHRDITAVWRPTRIYDSAPRVPVNVNALPIVFLQLQTLTPDYAGRQASFGTVSVWYRYLITGLFTFPSDPNTTLEAAKIALAQPLVTFLTASVNYVGYPTHLASVQFAEGTTSTADPERQEPVLEIPVGFDVEVDTPL